MCIVLSQVMTSFDCYINVGQLDSHCLVSYVVIFFGIIFFYVYNVIIHQGWGQVQLTKYSSTPSTSNIYQVQVLVKYSGFKKST